MSNFIIRKMKETEVQLAIDWAQKEGWNPGLNDAHCFYQADPEGFFIGLLNDEPIAVGSAVAYGDQFAFCGLYIVKKEFRSHGYGISLTDERLKYAGNRITGIDGVVENVSKYERLGYTACYKQVRYELASRISSTEQSHVVDLKTVAFKQLEELDRKYFPGPRSHFLQSWIHQPYSYALGYLENQHIEGYGVIRKCFHGYKIGPLFAKNPMVAKTLFEALCAQVNEGPIYLDIPEPNQQARSLVNHYKMAPKFEVIRMYRNGIPEIDLEGVYGVTTFELG